MMLLECSTFLFSKQGRPALTGFHRGNKGSFYEITLEVKFIRVSCANFDNINLLNI